jgi:PadR family transcriptional regulator
MVLFGRRSGQATVVVLALAEQPATWRYGYELCQRLDLKAGTLYPVLMGLADRGVLETTWESQVPAGRPPAAPPVPADRSRPCAGGEAGSRAADAGEGGPGCRPPWAATGAGGRMKRTQRVGGLVVAAAVAAPFAVLWVIGVNAGDQPLSAQDRLEAAFWVAVLAAPWMLAAGLLWRAWWRQAGAELAALDGPARLLAAATLPTDRRDWGRRWRPSWPRCMAARRGGGSPPAAPAQPAFRRTAAVPWCWSSWWSPSRRRLRPRWRRALPCPRCGCSR